MIPVYELKVYQLAEEFTDIREAPLKRQKRGLEKHLVDT